LVIELRFLGGCNEVGRSAVLVNKEVLLDYGIKAGEPPLYPLNGITPEIVLASHGHLDHSGLIPNLMDLNPQVHMSHLTRSFTAMLAWDTLKIAGQKHIVEPFHPEDIQQFNRKAQAHEPPVQITESDYTFEFHDAGHIPGSTTIFLEHRGQTLLYTGDINTQDTLLLKGAKLGELPPARIAIVESTYFGSEHPPRAQTEQAFIDTVRCTLELGGTALIPCFAIGRTQEILMLLHRHNIHAFVDGMGIDATKIIQKHPEYIKNENALNNAFKAATRLHAGRRNIAFEEPSVIVTTAGMLNGGPVLYYIKKLFDDARSKILLTGYQVEDTNGRRAIESGYIEDDNTIYHLKPQVLQFDFSAHCGERELKKLATHLADRGTETIITVHGEDTAGFARWIEEEIGIDARAPRNGDIIHL
jgi:putative mRNA 3-end processing factor